MLKKMILTSISEDSDSGKGNNLGETVNKKGKCDKSLFLFLDVREVNDLPYFVLFNRIFSSTIMVPGRLRHHFETNHSEFKEKGTEYFKNDNLFKSQSFFCYHFSK